MDGMMNMNCIVSEKSGVNHITLAPVHASQKPRFGVIEGALLLGFMTLFIGLVILLA